MRLRGRGMFAGCRRLDTVRDAPVETLLGGRNPLTEARVGDEVAGRFIEVRGDRFHRRHALCDEREIGLEESDSAVERLAQPVIERLRETYPVPSFGHFRAAGERVAGAVDLL